MNHETHYCCNKRLKEEGGKAKCCDCHPHQDCQLYLKECYFCKKMVDGRDMYGVKELPKPKEKATIAGEVSACENCVRSWTPEGSIFDGKH